ncbi:MAG: hypothetical protein HY861_04865 [Chlamydiia bacterium]|nr:hypothetical protein [Chlamydiia bacterium]
MDKEPLLHSFIFSPGKWCGEGKILLNMVEEELLFNTNWAVQNRDFSGKVACAQEVLVQGLSENMRNELTFYDFQHRTFSVDMENQSLGRIVGTGLFDEQTIAWEFRNNDMNFEGYETYVLQPDGSYHMRGEYVTSDQFRTQIEARIWQQSNEASNTDEPQENENEEGL